MRSKVVIGLLVGFGLIAGCSSAKHIAKTPILVGCDAGVCAIKKPGKPLNPATQQNDDNVGDIIGDDEDGDWGIAMPVTVPEVKHCPSDDMVFVSGEYCSKPNHDTPAVDETGLADPTCLEYIEPPCASGGSGKFCKMARCKRYSVEALRCLVPTRHISVCIDRFEYHDPGDELPATDYVFDRVSGNRVPLNFHNAKKVCEEQGKRLCKETEWEQSCQSDANYPYPTGLIRPSSPVCNLDNRIYTDKLGRPLRSMLKPNSELMACQSAYGIVAMSGDADEITIRDRSAAPSHPKEVGEHQNALKGGWSSGIRGRCHPATTAHSDEFHEAQLGFRCCSDPSNQ